MYINENEIRTKEISCTHKLKKIVSNDARRARRESVTEGSGPGMWYFVEVKFAQAFERASQGGRPVHRTRARGGGGRGGGVQRRRAASKGREGQVVVR